MADTIREIIIQEIIARLAVITIANGYNTDCGLKVFRARKRVDDDNDLPCLVVWPGPETAEKVFGSLQCKMTVRLEGFALFGSENASVVSERILGDIIKAMTSPLWSRSPDYVDSIIYSSGGAEDYPDEGNISVGSQATFTIGYSVALGDPYNQ
jgi:hypothetical protein